MVVIGGSFCAAAMATFAGIHVRENLKRIDASAKHVTTNMTRIFKTDPNTQGKRPFALCVTAFYDRATLQLCTQARKRASMHEPDKFRFIQSQAGQAGGW